MVDVSLNIWRNSSLWKALGWSWLWAFRSSIGIALWCDTCCSFLYKTILSGWPICWISNSLGIFYSTSCLQETASTCDKKIQASMWLMDSDVRLLLPLWWLIAHAICLCWIGNCCFSANVFFRASQFVCRPLLSFLAS